MMEEQTRFRAFIIVMTLFALCSAGTTALAQQQTGDQQPAGNEASVQYLFVQHAHAFSSQGNSLTLHGVAPATLYFSDRPERIAGHGTTEEMVRTWSEGVDSFARNPPNATLSFLGEGELEDVVVVLRDPRLLGSELTYTVEVLEGKLPASAGLVSLFIDVIGRPLTPVSVAGVARRTARRTVRRRW
jgi:hypothetical protein